MDARLSVGWTSVVVLMLMWVFERRFIIVYNFLYIIDKIMLAADGRGTPPCMLHIAETCA